MRVKSDVSDLLQYARREEGSWVSPVGSPTPLTTTEDYVDPRGERSVGSPRPRLGREEGEEEGDSILPIDIEVHVTINVDYGKISLRTEER